MLMQFYSNFTLQKFCLNYRCLQPLFAQSIPRLFIHSWKHYKFTKPHQIKGMKNTILIHCNCISGQQKRTVVVAEPSFTILVKVHEKHKNNTWKITTPIYLGRGLCLYSILQPRRCINVCAFQYLSHLAFITALI